jgi:hypothetical protein
VHEVRLAHGAAAMTGHEVWRAVAGYEGRYEVSDQGQVRALRFRRRNFDRLRDVPLVLTPRANRDGYRMVRLGSNPGRVAAVHRLVLETFVGPCPAGLQGAHLNGDPGDNRLVNLQWKSCWENHQDKIRHGRAGRGPNHLWRLHPELIPRGNTHGAHLHPERMARGERVHTAKLTADRVREIRAAVAGGQMPTAVAARFGVARSTVGDVVKRRTWRHVEAAPVTGAGRLYRRVEISLQKDLRSLKALRLPTDSPFGEPS